jgi:hypothetical protein
MLASRSLVLKTGMNVSVTTICTFNMELALPLRVRSVTSDVQVMGRKSVAGVGASIYIDLPMLLISKSGNDLL